MHLLPLPVSYFAVAFALSIVVGVAFAFTFAVVFFFLLLFHFPTWLGVTRCCVMLQCGFVSFFVFCSLVGGIVYFLS